MTEFTRQPKPFSLPEYTRAVVRFFHKSVSKLMEAKDEVFAMIPKAEPGEAIPITQNTMPSGEIIQSAPIEMSAQFTFALEHIRSCDTDELAAQIDSIADQNLSVVMPRLFDLLSRTCGAAGTGTDAGGRPFSFELFLESLEKAEIQFDKEGAPEWPKLIVSPQLAEYIKRMPPPTVQQRKQLADLVERKRTEYNARRRNRNLR
jgi:hypothetical protein